MFCFPFSALQEAQDIFGLEFDLSEFDADGGYDDMAEEDDEDLTPEEVAAKKKAKQAKKKGSRKSIYQVCLFMSLFSVAS